MTAKSQKVAPYDGEERSILVKSLILAFKAQYLHLPLYSLRLNFVEQLPAFADEDICMHGYVMTLGSYTIYL